MLLAGDIGGTKTVLATFEQIGADLKPVLELKYASREHSTFQEILSSFLDSAGRPQLAACCCGIAGPVIEGKVVTTNLPWHLEEGPLAAESGAPVAKLLNDLEATAFGMLFLKPEEFAVLNAGAQPPRKGSAAVIAAGTGLGEALLYWDGDHYHPGASEGGHTDFAPRNELEVEFWRYLSNQQKGHVSYERVLSGPGLYNLYQFLRDTKKGEESADLRAEIAAGDPSAVISQHGLKGDIPLCQRTLEAFVSIYGAEAANCALKFLGVSGVFIGGGIAPKILPALQGPAFMKAYLDKGRLRDYLAAIPVRVALNPKAALLGAAHYADRLSRGIQPRPDTVGQTSPR